MMKLCFVSSMVVKLRDHLVWLRDNGKAYKFTLLEREAEIVQ